ncbi:hypothetical protein IWZ03DRAFT_375637 [Phyllosticta citriasiana]|uniref:Uncharacterized protein n=2 Tax=Phyllosticta citriasiana TaxID=595635 RepID=A0ABR1KQI6_9PEZI
MAAALSPDGAALTDTVSSPLASTNHQPKKSPPNAFQPTPNDALYMSLSSLPPPVFPMPTTVPVRESIPSASQLPSNASSRQASSMVRSPLTPPDHGMVNPIHTAASQLGLNSTSVEEWRSLLQDARGGFEKERQTWDQERRLYQREISMLRQQMEAKESELLVIKTKLKQTELAVEDPDGFHRQIVSPPSANGTGTAARVSPVKSPPAVDAPRSSMAAPADQPSVPSTGKARFPTFDFTHHGTGEISSSAVTQQTGLNFEEDPPSPATTAANLSPAPESYRRHAGHTPGKPGTGPFSAFQTPGEKTPRPHQFVPPVDDQASIQTDGSEEGDLALQEPLFLPPNPERSEGSMMLGALQEKLASISENPDEARPAVLQGAPPSDTTASEIDAMEPPAALPSDVEEVPGTADHEVPGIKLKKKRSCNFGAPIGTMPRYRNQSDFDDY